MENFRPPAMDEVQKQQLKRKYMIHTIFSVSIIIIGIAAFLGVKKVSIYLNYLSVEKKYQVLNDFYKALSINDTDITSSIAPDLDINQHTNIVSNIGSYSLYIYPEMQTNKDVLIFTIINHSSTPSISYLNEVTYNIQDNITIKQIKQLGIGRQIN